MAVRFSALHVGLPTPRTIAWLAGLGEAAQTAYQVLSVVPYFCWSWPPEAILCPYTNIHVHSISSQTIFCILQLGRIVICTINSYVTSCCIQ
jgi:hypothetical protein